MPASSPTITVNVISRPANGFETPSTTQLQMAPGQSAIADFNHDGIPDVAVLGGSAGLAILIGNGDGTFKAPAYYPTPGHNASMLVAGDFNGDGYSDVALVEGGSQNFQVANLMPMMNNGDGTFTFNSGTIVLLPLTAAGIAAGDYNGDGKTDLCVIDRNDSIASFFKGSSTGLVLDGRLQIDPAGKGLLPSAVAFGDFDGDGKLDLALAGRSLDGVGVTSILRFLHGDGAGHFGAFADEADQTIDGGWGVPYAIGTGDLNGDRVDDVSSPGSPAIPSSALRKASTFSTATDQQLKSIRIWSMGSTERGRGRFGDRCRRRRQQRHGLLAERERRYYVRSSRRQFQAADAASRVWRRSE